MRRFSATASLVVPWLLLASLVGCSTQPPPALIKEAYEVSRGDLVLSAPAEGNLSLPRQVDLSFEIPGRLAEIRVKEGARVIAGQQIARLDDAGYQIALKSAENDLQIALSGLRTAELDYKATEGKLEAARVDQEIAEYSLRQSQVEYTVNIEGGGLRVKVKDLTDIAFTDLPGVRLALEEADFYLGNARGLLTAGDPAGAQAQMDLAQKRMTIAQQKSEGKRLQIPLDVKVKELQLEQSYMAIEVAKSQVDRAKEAVKAAGLNVDRARIAVERAKEDARKTVLVAPFDGVVTRVNAQEGKTVSAFAISPICHLADVSSLQMEGTVNEFDIAGVETGLPAVVTLDAFPDNQIRGKLGYISPVAGVEGGVVSYRVTIALEPATGLTIREGMSANASIIIARRSNVLMLPRQAVRRTPQGSEVEVVVNRAAGKTEKRGVTTGLSNEAYTEIISGVEPGEKVIIEAPPTVPRLSSAFFGGQ